MHFLSYATVNDCLPDAPPSVETPDIWLLSCISSHRKAWNDTTLMLLLPLRTLKFDRCHASLFIEIPEMTSFWCFSFPQKILCTLLFLNSAHYLSCILCSESSLYSASSPFFTSSYFYFWIFSLLNILFILWIWIPIILLCTVQQVGGECSFTTHARQEGHDGRSWKHVSRFRICREFNAAISFRLWWWRVLGITMMMIMIGIKMMQRHNSKVLANVASSSWWWSSRAERTLQQNICNGCRIIIIIIVVVVVFLCN